MHDIKLNTSLDDVLPTELCFISVPSPQCADGSCDVSIVDRVVRDLHNGRDVGLDVEIAA